MAAASISKEESDHGQAEFLILTELCTGKLLFNSVYITRILAKHQINEFVLLHVVEFCNIVTWDPFCLMMSAEYPSWLS